MEHYLAHTDYPIWEVIQKGNGPVSVTTDTDGVIRVLPPRTAEETLARERERKAKTILLMALPEDKIIGGEMLGSLEIRIGAELERRRTLKHCSESDTWVTSCSNECKESYAKLKKLYDAHREQLSDASIEIKAYTQALKKVEEQLVAHLQGQLWYEQKIKFMKIDLDDKTDVLTYHKKLLAEAMKEKEDLKAKVEKWHNSSKNLGKLLNTQMSANDKFRLGYGDHRYDGILSYENKVL
ncbi:hypothetical protein Tco_0676562 [Tanacetum coccineum]